MGTRRLSMRQLREILRLKHEQKLSRRAIARACRVGVGTVSEYVRRAARAGLEWPLPEELDEAALEARLFSSAGPGSRERVVPDVERIHQELKRVGVTLHLLWEEYREANPKGYAYSQFCVIYGRWAQKLKPSMRQVHRSCLGLMSLGRRYGAQRLEAASSRALHLESYSYRTVKNILSSAQDGLPFEDTETPPTPHHDNIRGAAYYADPKESTHATGTNPGEDEPDEAIGHGRGPRATPPLESVHGPVF